MKIILLWPYNIQAIEIPELFPIGIGYILANIDKQRHEVHFIDCTLDRLAPDSNEFKKKIADISPDVIGISFWSNNAVSIYTACATIRSIQPKAKIVFGGPHATTYGQFEIKQKHADFVIAGEAERSFPQLLEAIEANNKKSLSAIPGLIYSGGKGQIVINPPLRVNDLDSLGTVDYKALRLRDYHKAGYGYKGQAVLHPNLPSAMIISTRGCPYRCKFCSAPIISGKKVRVHSPDYVAKTIKLLYDNFGVRVISIGDDNFTINNDYATQMCKAIIDLKLDDLVMTAPNGFRMTSVNNKLAALMCKAGWEEVTIAPESGSPRTLELMRKDLDLKVVTPFVEMCHNEGLKVKANFIIGFPGETLEDVLLTERFIHENNFDQIGLCFFQPLPGTPIFDDLVRFGDIDESFIPARYSQITYCPKGIEKKDLCEIFNRIWNNFRNSKGWRYKNNQVGTIRNE